jgi:hypothetical protein
MNEHELKEELHELKERLEVLEAANFMLVELLFAENPRLETLALANKHKIKTRKIADEVAVSHLTGTIGEDHIENLINLRVGHRASA